MERITNRCQSTHGGAGYMLGSYWDGDVIVCLCGQRIENPRPTGGTYVYYTFRENPWKWLTRKVKRTEPRWPDWIPSSKPPVQLYIDLTPSRNRQPRF